MSRFTPILMILLALVPLFYSLDCRKFSFAPACRGIMLKRSGGLQMVDQTLQLREELADKTKEIQILSWLLRSIEEEGAAKGDCVSTSWLKNKIYNANYEI